MSACICGSKSGKKNDHTCEESFAEAMDRLRACMWYWGPISWQEAESVLNTRPSGSFLLRDSSSDRYIFTISFKTPSSVVHARLPQHAGKFCFGGPDSLLCAETVMEFIEKTVKHSSDGRLHFFMHPKNELDRAINIRLVHPVSRISVLPSLKHLCRFEVLRRVRPDQVDQLPLPTYIRNYLRDPKYIAEVPRA